MSHSPALSHFFRSSALMSLALTSRATLPFVFSLPFLIASASFLACSGVSLPFLIASSVSRSSSSSTSSFSCTALRARRASSLSASFSCPGYILPPCFSMESASSPARAISSIFWAAFSAASWAACLTMSCTWSSASIVLTGSLPEASRRS